MTNKHEDNNSNRHIVVKKYPVSFHYKKINKHKSQGPGKTTDLEKLIMRRQIVQQHYHIQQFHQGIPTGHLHRGIV